MSLESRELRELVDTTNATAKDIRIEFLSSYVTNAHMRVDGCFYLSRLFRGDRIEAGH